jgi:signal transduction histidine kinase
MPEFRREVQHPSALNLLDFPFLGAAFASRNAVEGGGEERKIRSFLGEPERSESTMSGMSQVHRELSVASMKDGSNGVLVAMRDSGPGLDSTALDRLFDAFYTSKPDGMGMGLAISRTIVEAHGGQLWAMPNVPRGAIFQFRLPSDGEEASSSKQMQS